LLARGLVKDRDPYAVALVLTNAPPAPPPELVARRVETFDECAAACAVQWSAFKMPDEDIAETRLRLAERWSDPVNLRHAVWLDGEIVSTGTASQPSAQDAGRAGTTSLHRGENGEKVRLGRAFGQKKTPVSVGFESG
jgi:hypothetical protein